MPAWLTGLLSIFPTVASWINQIIAAVKKTPAQQQADTTAAQQSEAQQMEQTGRPKWD